MAFAMTRLSIVPSKLQRSITPILATTLIFAIISLGVGAAYGVSLAQVPTDSGSIDSSRWGNA